MSNDLFREVTQIIRTHTNPFVAEQVVTDACAAIGRTPDDIAIPHLSHLMLDLAINTDLVTRVKPQHFTSMMRKIMVIADREETPDQGGIQRLMIEHRRQERAKAASSQVTVDG